MFMVKRAGVDLYWKILRPLLLLVLSVKVLMHKKTSRNKMVVLTKSTLHLCYYYKLEWYNKQIGKEPTLAHTFHNILKREGGEWEG